MPTAVSEDSLQHTLVTSREPVGAKEQGDPNAKGEQALRDAITVLVIGWLLLFLLAWSLRRYNV